MRPRRPIGVIGCVLAMQLLSGCLHLHSAALQKASEAAKTEFDTMVVTGPSSATLAGFFDTALTLAVVQDIHRLDRETQLATLLDQTWKSLLDRTRQELQKAEGDLTTATTAKTTAEERLKGELVKLGLAQKDVANYVDALNEASRAAARYAATQALLAEALKAAVDRTRDKSFDGLRDTLNKTFKFESFERTAAGELKTTTKEETAGMLLGLGADVFPKGAPKTVEDVEGLVKTIGKLDTVPAALKNLTFRSPGIATTIVGLGFDVARAAEREAAAAVRTSKQEIQLRESQQAFLRRHIRRLNDDLNGQGVGLAAAATLESDHGRSIRATLTRMIDEYQQSTTLPNRGRLHLMYLALATNFKVRVVDAKERESLEDRVTALLPQQALANDVARLGLREAVIGRGLDGLIAFHAGGITPDDFARIIGIAQTIGIFIIAGGS